MASYISNKIDYKLDTFTYDFDDADSKGESSQVNKIAKILNVKNYKYILKPKIILNQFDFLTLKLEFHLLQLDFLQLTAYMLLQETKNIML